jgi:predicted RNase H-like nuclease (RuvC/YqgF family)
MDFARELERELTALTAERDQLRAEVERFKEWLADPHALHAHCLRTLTEGQIAHLFGERMTEIVNRVERAEAELATERARLDWLRDNVEEIYSKDQHGIVYLSGDNIRAAIDAGIKEGAK